MAAGATDLLCQTDKNRRHALRRTPTALHVVCGAIGPRWGGPMTGVARRGRVVTAGSEGPGFTHRRVRPRGAAAGG